MHKLPYLSHADLERKLRATRRFYHALLWLERRSPVLGKIFRQLIRASLWDLHYGLTEVVSAISALIILSAVAIGVDGWTVGQEKRWFVLGVMLIAFAIIQQRGRGKFLIQLYRIHKRDLGSQVEAKSMGFDIRESYIDRILSLLNNDYPGTIVYGRYFTPQGLESQTPKFSVGQTRNWENRANKRIRSLCFAWKDDSRSFRVEYRRTPAQIYADRFIETTGLEEATHIRLREIFAKEEWACKPRFEWITKMGLYWSVLLGVAVIFVLLGQPTLYLSSDEPFPMSRLTLVARALFVQVLIIIVFVAVLSSARAYYFPSGILRIDEEVEEQKRKDVARTRFMKCIFLAFLGLVGVLMVEPVLQLCSDADGNGIGFFREVGWNLSESPVCKYILPSVLE